MRRLAGTCALLLAAGACLAGNTAGASAASARRAPSKSRRVVCQHLRGKTIAHHGTVRVFSSAETIYGCLDGLPRAWRLWEDEHNLYQGKGGAVQTVVGRFVAFSRTSSSQYGFSQSLEVVNLASGAIYTVYLVAEEDGSLTGVPPTPGPQPLEAFRLGPNGRTVRLYYTFAPSPSTKPDYSAPPTGQVLDVIGFDGFNRKLATCAPGAIRGGSLSYDGRRVSWRQDGAQHSVRL